MNAPAPPIRALSLTRALVGATILFAVDAIWLNQGVMALLVAAWVVLVGLPRAALAGKYAGVRAKRARNLAIYLAAAVLVWAFNWANNQLARQRAELVIAAVNAYHAKNQRYPASLEELVPQHIDRIPAAKYTLAFNRFVYLPSSDGAFLYYVALPPFGRPTYSFARGDWGYMD